MTNINTTEPTETPNKLIPSPAVRKWIYGIIVAVGAVAVLYGLITQDQLAAWVSVVNAILLVGGGGLALVNTPPKG